MRSLERDGSVSYAGDLQADSSDDDDDRRVGILLGPQAPPQKQQRGKCSIVRPNAMHMITADRFIENGVHGAKALA